MALAVCSKCGLDLPTRACYKRAACQNCIVQKQRAAHSSKTALECITRYEERELIKAKAQLEVWQERIAAVPKDYHTLTEEEWDQAVKYFDGKCAFCQDKKFAYRGMFLLVDQGGRYCDWNVVPICETCVVKPKNKNPFRFMNTAYIGSTAIAAKRKYNKKKLAKIINYLEPILLRAMASGNVQQD